KNADLLEDILRLNAPFRAEEQIGFDKTQDWISFVNLRLSEISTNLLKFSRQWHEGKALSWLIMSFDPGLLCDPGVYFSTTNNIYPLTRRALEGEGLEAVFAPVVPRKPGWTVTRRSRAPHLPTCEQAEVLYPNGLPMKYLRRVYVLTGADSDWVHSVLPIYDRSDVEV